MADQETSAKWEQARNSILELGGAFDPLADKAAKQLASFIPQNHWLRSWYTQSGLGVAAAFVEGAADKFKNPRIAGGIELTADFMKAFAAYLVGKLPEKDGAASVKLDEDWVKNFRVYAEEQIRKNPCEATAKTLEDQFDLSMRVIGHMLERLGGKPPDPATVEIHRKTMQQEWETCVKPGIERDLKRLTPHVRTATNWLQQRQAARRRKEERQWNW